VVGRPPRRIPTIELAGIGVFPNAHITVAAGVDHGDVTATASALCGAVVVAMERQAAIDDDGRRRWRRAGGPNGLRLPGDVEVQVAWSRDGSAEA
jgi:hypothetical protein